MACQKVFKTLLAIAIWAAPAAASQPGTPDWLCSGSGCEPRPMLALAPDDSESNAGPELNGQTDADIEAIKNTEKTRPDCIGKYCMSLFTKTRTAKTVGKGWLSVALKYQYIDYDDKKGSDERYHDLGSDRYIKNKAVLTLKYGWAEDHHLGFSAPYMWNDFDVSGKVNTSQDFGNLALFEKWNLIKETEYIPGVAVDLWFYFPTGHTDRKLGSSQYSWKLTAELSKAWPDFSLHLNPGYVFTKDRSADAAEFNAAVIFTPCKTFWPALEYNFEHNESKGFSHDIVPGIIWRFAPGWSFKVAGVINLDSSKSYRDDLGLVMKLFYCFPLHK